ncbi:glucoamylase family protein [Luteimonas sp. R10]|uniref:glucoamylase family protein n=1 Tax=Luteimonas sp. R10 TaxID=3108176 RepID=UPI00308AC61C|nr:glucoamylase family protein [Luteimonas sp. R10]
MPSDRGVKYAADRYEALARQHARWQRPRSRLRPEAALLACNAGLESCLSAIPDRVDSHAPADDIHPLLRSSHFLQTTLKEIASEFREVAKYTLPFVVAEGGVQARIQQFVEQFAVQLSEELSASSLREAISAYQRHAALEQVELHAIRPLLSLILLDRILQSGAGSTNECARCDGTDRRGGFRAGRRDKTSPDLSESTPDSTEDDGAVRGRAQSGAVIEAWIGNLRALRKLCWSHFICSVSVTESTLARDPSGDYPDMDAITRERYRWRVFDLAVQSGRTEAEVAEIVIALAQQSAAAAASERARHVGYYLLDEGVASVRQQIGGRTDRQRLECLRKSGVLIWAFIAAQLIIAGTVTAGIMLWVAGSGASGLMRLVAAATCIVVASQIGAAFIAWIATFMVRPRPLPRMDYRKGLPSRACTWVVVPCLLESRAGAISLVDDLHMRFLANRDSQLYFALLSDFPDAPSKSMPDDDDAWYAAAEAIERLNDKYPAADGTRFLLLHRDRVWSEDQGVWMGYERKRGKLDALNAFLLREADSLFDRLVGRVPEQSRARYVVTLDSDTEMSWGGVRRLVETIDHPLNRPELVDGGRSVGAGHAILQPRVSFRLPSQGASGYQRLQKWERGVDPYSLVASSLYHDLFVEGSYVGKGIYDVAAFRNVMKDRFPDNRILSHDLIEGCYARSTVAADVEVYEQPAKSQLVDLSRRERWIRGDWQISAWLWPYVPVRTGYTRNTLSTLSRWKIFDSLRRSLVEPAALAALVVAWLHPGMFALAVVVLLLYLLQPFLDCMRFLWIKVTDSLNGVTNTGAFTDIGLALARPIYAMATLPQSAAASVMAIAKAQWRLRASHRKLLEWEPFSLLQHAENSPAQRARATSAAIAFALVGAGSLAALGIPTLWHAVPWGVIWCVAPLAGLRLSRPRYAPAPVLDEEDRALLQRAARRTWAYFEDFTNEALPLPPDNVRELPRPDVSLRTSPTNIGFGLLSIIAAYDLGYIGRTECLSRIERSLAEIKRLEKYRGHLYNWYSIGASSKPQSSYVSAVDSGNFVACVLVLRSALLGMSLDHSTIPQMLSGVSGTFAVLCDSRSHIDERKLADFAFQLDAALHMCESRGEVEDLQLQKLTAAAEHLRSAASSGAEADARYWAEKLWNHCNALAVEEAHATNASEMERKVAVLVGLCDRLMDCSFDLFFSTERQMLHIGIDALSGVRDDAHYDLLASEVRLTVYIAAARNDIPIQAWAALGRQFTYHRRAPALLSWGGSIFEYLMPDLLMPVVPGSLLDVSRHGALAMQIRHGGERAMPWGISESAYAEFDENFNYRYCDFGISSLGLKPRSVAEMVVSPYSSALALLIEPQAAVRNLTDLERLGMLARYGYYEALDFTLGRASSLSECKGTIVREHMAHHQGMSLLGFAAVLCGQLMHRRFLDTPELRAASTLLDERMPTRFFAVS